MFSKLKFGMSKESIKNITETDKGANVMNMMQELTIEKYLIR